MSTGQTLLFYAATNVCLVQRQNRTEDDMLSYPIFQDKSRERQNIFQDKNENFDIHLKEMHVK